MLAMADQREMAKTPFGDLEESLTFSDLVCSFRPFISSPWGCGFPDLEGPCMSRPFPPSYLSLQSLVEAGVCSSKAMNESALD